MEVVFMGGWFGVDSQASKHRCRRRVAHELRRELWRTINQWTRINSEQGMASADLPRRSYARRESNAGGKRHKKRTGFNRKDLKSGMRLRSQGFASLVLLVGTGDYNSSCAWPARAEFHVLVLVDSAVVPGHARKRSSVRRKPRAGSNRCRYEYQTARLAAKKAEKNHVMGRIVGSPHGRHYGSAHVLPELTKLNLASPRSPALNNTSPEERSIRSSC